MTKEPDHRKGISGHRPETGLVQEHVKCADAHKPRREIRRPVVSLASVLLFALAAFRPANAGTIVWISQVESESGVEFIELLEEAGHEVTEMVTSDPSNDQIESMNNADLVVFGRKIESVNYNTRDWDEISAPMLVLTPYVLRKNKWGWYEGNGLRDATPNTISADEPDHPLFDGIPLRDGVSEAWHVEIGRGTSFGTDAVINGGTRIASAAGVYVVAAEWPAGTVAQGPRFHLALGSRELSGESIGNAGQFNLTELGAIAFLNAVAIYSPQTTVFQITQISYSPGENQVSFSWPSRDGQDFRVERSTDLVAWEELDDAYPAAEGSPEATTYVDGDLAGVTHAFYRVTRD